MQGRIEPVLQAFWVHLKTHGIPYNRFSMLLYSCACAYLNIHILCVTPYATKGKRNNERKEEAEDKLGLLGGTWS